MGGWSFVGVAIRAADRILTLAAVIWHNHHTSQPTTLSDRFRSLTTSELLNW
jgi:hypothetical protein